MGTQVTDGSHCSHLAKTMHPLGCPQALNEHSWALGPGHFCQAQVYSTAGPWLGGAPMPG